MFGSTHSGRQGRDKGPLRRIDSIALFLSGCIAVGAVQQLVGWWLNSGTGVAAMLVCLTAIACLAGRGSSEIRRARAIALWSGAMVATTAILIVIGPGTIWPLVLLFAGVLLAGAVLLGIALRWLVLK